LFPDTQQGVEASALLAKAGISADWLKPQLGGKRRTLVEIPPRVFQVTITPVVLPGEEERIHVIAFLPVGRAGEAETNGTRRTLISATSVRS
jgi:hypothetical protein